MPLPRSDTAARRIPAYALAALLALAVPAGAQTVRLDCGGDGVAAGGVSYESDRAYDATKGSGHLGGAPLDALALQPDFVEGTPDPRLFDTARVAPGAYRFDVAPGLYRVKLHFAEIEKHGPGQRVFSVAAEGRTLLENLDLFALVEKDYAVTYQFAVPVPDGRLDVEFVPVVGEPIVSGIAVTPLDADTTPPPSPAGFVALGGYARNVLAWDPVGPDDLAGWLVYRAAQPEGPYSLLTPRPHPAARWLDDTVAAGATRHYRVQAIDASGNRGPMSAVRSATTRARAESRLPFFDLSLGEAELAALRADPFADDYVPGAFARDGLLHPGVGIRFRGATSRHHNKKSWKLNFPSDAPFLGFDKLNLAARNLDSTLLRECLTTILLERSRALAPRCDLVNVAVNGVHRGVHATVEQTDRAFLDRRGFDPDSNVYEATGLLRTGFAWLPDESVYPWAWEKETNEAGSYADLAEFLALVNQTPAAELAPRLAARFHVDGYLDYAVVMTFSAQLDHVFTNIGLVHHADRGVWEMLPHDYDGSFSFAHAPIDYGTLRSPGLFGDSNVLLSRVLAEPLFRQRFADKLRERLATDLSLASFGALVDALFGWIAPEARVDPYKRGAERNQLFENGPAYLRGFAAARHAFLGPALDAFDPRLAKRVQINEVLASNAGGLADEAGEREDWIELVNATGAEVDLGGYSLGDDLEQGGSWSFPPGTRLPAGGRLLVWADEDEEQGSLHADFKLSKGGESVGLFAPAAEGGALVDFVTFPKLGDDESYGRRRDGSSMWAIQAAATPNAPNLGAGNRPPNPWGARLAPAVAVADEPVQVSARIEDEVPATVVAKLWADTGGGFVEHPFRDDGLSNDESPGDTLYGGTIPAVGTGNVVRWYVEAQDAAGRVAFEPEAGAAAPFTYAIQAATRPLFVNEVMADNDGGISDEAGDTDDWVELYNAGDAAIDLSGMFLTDSVDEPRKWEIPAGTTIAAGGFLLFWADSEPSEGPLHANFGLSRGGEAIALFDRVADGNAQIDGFAFPAQTTDVSWGRTPDGGAALGALPVATPGAPNPAP